MLEDKLVDLIGLAKQNPDRAGAVFLNWFGWSSHSEMPPWTIEKFVDGEAHIHFFDYATGAIKAGIREYCSNSGLRFSARMIDGYFPTEYLHISKNNKDLLQIHNTTCSTTARPYICVHLQANTTNAKILLDLFGHIMDEEDLEFYKKRYAGD